MLWLVNSELGPAWNFYCGNKSPLNIFNRARDFNSFALQFLHRGRNVVAHQLKLVVLRALGGVYSQLSWRQCENEPSASRVDGWEAENIAKECANFFRIFCIDKRMNAIDHGFLLFSMNASQAAIAPV